MAGQAEGGNAAVGRARPDAAQRAEAHEFVDGAVPLVGIKPAGGAQVGLRQAAQLAEVEQRHDQQRDQEGVVAEAALPELVEQAAMPARQRGVHGAQADGAGGKARRRLVLRAVRKGRVRVRGVRVGGHGGRLHAAGFHQEGVAVRPQRAGSGMAGGDWRMVMGHSGSGGASARKDDGQQQLQQGPGEQHGEAQDGQRGEHGSQGGARGALPSGAGVAAGRGCGGRLHVGQARARREGPAGGGGAAWVHGSGASWRQGREADAPVGQAAGVGEVAGDRVGGAVAAGREGCGGHTGGGEERAHGIGALV